MTVLAEYSYHRAHAMPHKHCALFAILTKPYTSGQRSIAVAYLGLVVVHVPKNGQIHVKAARQFAVQSQLVMPRHDCASTCLLCMTAQLCAIPEAYG